MQDGFNFRDGAHQPIFLFIARKEPITSDVVLAQNICDDNRQDVGRTMQPWTARPRTELVFVGGECEAQLVYQLLNELIEPVAVMAEGTVTRKS